jgi:hypothetical protein
MAEEPNAAPPAAPPVSPEPAAPVSPPASPPAEPSLAGVKDYLVSQGVNADVFESDQAAADALLNAAQQYQQSKQYVEVGQQAAPLWDEFQQWQKERQPSEPTEPQEQGWNWERPEFDESWRRYIQNGELAPDTPVVVADKISRYVAWEQEKQREFLSDPQKMILGAATPRFQEIDKRFEGLQPGETIDQFLERKFEEKIAGYDAKRQSEAYFQEHLKEYYVTNEQGQPLRDPTSGEFALTPKGKAFAQHAQEAQQLGLSDQNAIRQYAERLVKADETQGLFAQDPTKPAPSPPVEAPKESFLEKALRSQQVDVGTVPAPNEPAPTDRTLSGLEIARDVLRESGDIP